MVIQGVAYPSDFEAKKAIIATAAQMEAKGFLVAGDGSLSVRVGPNAIWITVEGADKSALQQDQLVRIDMNGKQMATNKPKPLAEDLPIHLRIYKENELVQGIVHAYPACAAVLGIQGNGIEAAAFAPSVRKLGRIQMLPGSDAQSQAEAVGLLCRTDRGVLIRNDGCMMWGKSLAEAAQSVEALDYYCKVKKCARKSCTCGNSASGMCDGSCKASAPACSGNCAACASASVCPKCGKPVNAPAAVTAPAPVPVSSVQPVTGMTGIIRPGEALPVLPPVAAPAPAAVQPIAAPILPAAEKVLAVNVPKADVMAEVVRRKMGK